MISFVYTWMLLAAPLTVKMKGVPPGWKVTAHQMRNDEIVAQGLTFADVGEDDQIVAYISNKKELLVQVGTLRDAAADGALTLEFPDKTTLQGSVNFVDGPALEGLVGNAGRVAPFEKPEAKATFEALGASKMKIENGHFSVTVPTRVPGEVRFACVREKYNPAGHPTIQITLPVGMLEARVEDEKGKPMKKFDATVAGVSVSSGKGVIKHAVLAGCDLTLEVSAKGHVAQQIPMRVERGATLKLPTITLKKK